MQLFNKIQESLNNHSHRNAFYIKDTFYTYLEFAETVSKIRQSISLRTCETEKNIGLVANDDIETYASIIALWLEGKSYVPLTREIPRDRNESIMRQAALQTIIDSSDKPLFADYKLIESKKLPASEVNLMPRDVPETELVFILFTSGTTGQPKGVPITRANVTGFIAAFEQLDYQITADDRVLQMFELTFDLSVMSYLVPLLHGACVYTVPEDKIKYSVVYQLMEDHKLTCTLMVPSILHYLRQFFDEIKFPDMKYSLFCGEALPLDIIEEWSLCLPNARISNVYGPTENTIFCTCYDFKRKERNKSHNGVLSIGKAMKNTLTVIIDEDNNILPFDAIGQLCLGGVQQTPGYWKNEEKNNEAFFRANYNGKETKFYKTGDLCMSDEEGDIMYLGRIDFQTKIQGYRVELSEVEFHIKEFIKKINVAAVTFLDLIGNTELGLAIEGKVFDVTALQDYMKLKMPAYMIPKKIIFVNIFPLNVNGKTDRKKLELLFKSDIK